MNYTDLQKECKESLDFIERNYNISEIVLQPLYMFVNGRIDEKFEIPKRLRGNDK